MKFISRWDGQVYEMKPSHGTVWQWKEGKCWSVSCRNAIVFVHISDRGFWTHGYCNDSYQLNKCRAQLSGFTRRGGGWYMAVKGKLTEDKFWRKKA